MTEHNAVAALIDRWPTRAALADRIGEKTATVHKWAQNRSIPAWHHARVLDAAKSDGIDLTAEELIAANSTRNIQHAAASGGRNVHKGKRAVGGAPGDAA